MTYKELAKMIFKMSGEKQDKEVILFGDGKDVFIIDRFFPDYIMDHGHYHPMIRLIKDH